MVTIGTLNGGNITITTGGSAPSGHEETWYKYDGDTEWKTINIEGTIALIDEMGMPIGYIENPFDIVEIEIGTNVTSIGEWAFYGCGGLTSVTIPASVTYIGYDAFNNCSGLTSVTIPDSVTSIWDGAFSGCLGLTSMTFEGKNRATVQAMENYPFGLNLASSSGVTIHCTDGDIQVQYG